MPYSVHRLKGSKIRVINRNTGKGKTFRSKAAFRRWNRVAEAVKHGLKPKH
jgi:hypothetical protein